MTITASLVSSRVFASRGFSSRGFSSRIVPVVLATLSLAACFDDKSTTDPGAVPTTTSGETTNNKAPVVSGTPATAIPAGFPYVFKPVATDPEGDPLSFSVSGKPAWAEFVGATGELRGTPSEADLGDTAGITITASDGKATTTLGPFRVSVNRASGTSAAGGTRPPVIGGNPPTTVAAGSAYSFQVLASDADGDRLTYGARNLPAWLGIDTAKGVLSGTPSAAQVGIYNNIQVSVTDGLSTVSLTPFTITVTGSGTVASTAGTTGTTGGTTTAGTTTTATAGAGSTAAIGTATLSWIKPTQYSDGTPLVDLAGYIVKYGTDPGALSQRVSVADPNLTRYTVPSLGKGTWYFTVVSYTNTGLESDVATLVSKTIT